MMNTLTYFPTFEMASCDGWCSAPNSLTQNDDHASVIQATMARRPPQTLSSAFGGFINPAAMPAAPSDLASIGKHSFAPFDVRPACSQFSPKSAAVRAELSPHGIPAVTPKRFFPSSLQKAFSCRGPWPDCFQFSTRVLFPPALFRITNRQALEKAARSRQPIPLDRNLRIAQFRGGPTTAEAHTRHISTESGMGG